MAEEDRKSENLRILMDRSLQSPRPGGGSPSGGGGGRVRWVWLLPLLVVALLAGGFMALNASFPDLNLAALLQRQRQAVSEESAPEPDLGPVAGSVVTSVPGALEAKVVLTEADSNGLRTLAVLSRTAEGWQVAVSRSFQMDGNPRLVLEDLQGQGAIVLADAPYFRAFQAADLADLDYLRLTAPPASFGNKILVDKGKNALYLYRGGELSRVFRVGTGEDAQGPADLSNSFTPEGVYTIVNKVVNPDWLAPDGSKWVAGGDPANPLGTRWMGFSVLPGDGGNIWGIHGTFEPETVGHWVTNGCIRLMNADVEELFAAVEDGTLLEIINSYPRAILLPVEPTGPEAPEDEPEGEQQGAQT